MQNNLKRTIELIGIILVLLTTYAYSALSTSLVFVGDAIFRAVADIRITEVKLNNASNATLAYESTHKKDIITNGFTLNDSQSFITYRVTIKIKVQ